jgi:FtsH-binding integral membrane protein
VDWRQWAAPARSGKVDAKVLSRRRAILDMAMGPARHHEGRATMAYDPHRGWGVRETGMRGTHPAEIPLDSGLRAYMARVYNYMAGGLALTGIVAYVAAVSGFYQEIAGTPLIWVVMLAPLGFVMALSFGIQRMSAATAQLLFWIYAAVMGLSMAGIFLVFTGMSIARVFFIAAGMFAGMSLYGYTTKTDLTRFGSFLFMGLIGIVIASLVNLFVGSTALQFAISVIGVIVFTGLTAWDTQRIKEMYVENLGASDIGKMAVMGALTLYLDFINLFMMLLQLFGQRRDD